MTLIPYVEMIGAVYNNEVTWTIFESYVVSKGVQRQADQATVHACRGRARAAAINNVIIRELEKRFRSKLLCDSIHSSAGQQVRSYPNLG